MYPILPCVCPSVRWRPWFIVATVLRCLGAAILLLPLLLRQWRCTHWSHVYRIPIGGESLGRPSSVCCYGYVVPLQSHGWHYTLWDWVCPCLLWRRVCPVGPMVGLWVPNLGCKYHHLAWCGRLLVEDDRPVVSTQEMRDQSIPVSVEEKRKTIPNLLWDGFCCPQFCLRHECNPFFSWYRYICAILAAANWDDRVQFNWKMLLC
jgi:hypothetical protein